jgi:hypothetical protein
VVVGTHARALSGRTRVRATLDAVIDALDLIFDQTMRGILRGLGPDELRDFVRLPEPLASHPFLAEVYGGASHFAPYLYQHALGWFDGDAASINPLPPLEQARRLVDAMGGRAAVPGRAREALAARASGRGRRSWPPICTASTRRTRRRALRGDLARLVADPTAHRPGGDPTARAGAGRRRPRQRAGHAQAASRCLRKNATVRSHDRFAASGW